MNANYKELSAQGIGTDGNGSVYSIRTPSQLEQGNSHHFDKPIIVPEDEIIDFTTPPGQQQTVHQYIHNSSTSNHQHQHHQNNGQSYTPMSSGASTFNNNEI